jgi:hypothetical protein
MAFPTMGGGFEMPDLGKVFSKQYLPAMAIAFSSGLQAIGSWQQGQGLVEGAKRRQQAAEYEAQQLEVNAGQAKAASQRDAYWKELEGELLISATKARAGAGGMDPTVLNIIAGAMARKSYNMQASIYAGEEKSRLMTMQAESKRYDAALGLADARAARGTYALSAIGSLAQGGMSLYDRYWPKDTDAGKITPGRGYDMEFTP